MITMEDKKILIKVRGIILHDGKLFIVKHLVTGFIALPGGHLEYGEDIVTCLKRELIEELGVMPEVGRLLYINNYMNNRKDQYIEFFFEIKNGADYLHIDKLERTHADELADMLWVLPNDDIEILPKQLKDDFKNNKIFDGEVKFINEIKN